MAWLILEGLDRTGKSSIAEEYKKRGYEIIHMGAPNNKYSKPGYSGPSYSDEILDMYMKYTGKNVVFDRSIYGEQVWPFIYKRKPQIDDEAFEYLREIEEQNETKYILMYDADIEANWKRCVDVGEPLNKDQFKHAIKLFDRVAHKYNFEKKQLPSFNMTQETRPSVAQITEDKDDLDPVNLNDDQPDTINDKILIKSAEQIKLEKANAINSILSNRRILRQKGDIFDDIEKDIRKFLHGKLSVIFQGDTTLNDNFTLEEIQTLKMLASQMLLKAKNK